MGRKPNALITAYFTRGEKLADASNRYEYTCNACGQHFPKGRPEALTSHIVRKCPSLSAKDREAAVETINANNVVTQYRRLNEAFPGHYAGSRLHTLAEVSDRAGDEQPSKKKRKLEGVFDQYPARFDSHLPRCPPQPGDAHGQGRETVNDWLQRADTAVTKPPEQLPLPAALEEHPPNIDPQLQAPIASDPASTSPLQDQQPPHPAGSQSASDDTELRLDRTIALPPTHVAAAPDNETHEEHTLPHAVLDPQTEQNVAHLAQPEPLPQNMQSIFILNNGPNPPRRRTGFTTSRRAEVGTIRKIGACIRCRMLKKPCSEGSPCSACLSVSDARTWRSGCIRAKLRDEVDGAWWGSGPWSALAVSRIAAFERTKDTGRVVVGLAGFDKTMDVKSTRMQSLDGSSVWRIDIKESDLDAMSGILEQLPYAIVDKERSVFMRETFAFLNQKAAETNDLMLKQASTLWIGNTVLLDSQTPWEISVASTAGEQNETQGQEPDAKTVLSGSHYDILLVQIRAALERLCARLARSLAHSLERRLVDRKEAEGKRLETVLVATLLIGAGERLSSAMQAWGSVSHESNAEQNTPWPLERHVPSLLEQGTVFAELIGTMLIARDVAPKLGENENGELKVINSRQGVIGRAEAEAFDEWLLRTDLKVPHLKAAIDNEASSGEGNWDLRLVGRVLERCMPNSTVIPQQASMTTG